VAEQHKVLLAGADERDLTQLAEYQAIGGYRGVPKARAMTPDALIDELQKATLRGRGGAGFPMGARRRSSTARARSRSISSSTPTSRSRAPSRIAR